MYRSDIRILGYTLGVENCVITELSNANTDILVFEINFAPLKMFELHHIWPTEINNSKGSISPPTL